MPDRFGERIIAKLRARKLPQMVDWFDPGLLIRIGIRDMISGTIGQYADQRLMQAASDRVASEQDLALRYDYSNTHVADPDKRITLDAGGAAWIDYIADLGDGFESTYAMAYLMAGDKLAVRPASHEQQPLALDAGRILVMGGDQAYPQATAEEYENRLVKPYTWAFRTHDPERKLFAIPGNHDWYDGLGAFTSLFTAARSRISGGLGRQIGGWRSVQHRSYFAIKLPHDWWIWGPDIQLEGTLDDPQRDYFDIVGDYTKPGDKIVLCLAEPSWLHQNYDNLHEINLMARKRGAKVCAMLAGDWHHYSRYYNAELGIQFVTSGGGGAFAHASHQLKKSVSLDWATGTEDDDHPSENSQALGLADLPKQGALDEAIARVFMPKPALTSEPAAQDFEPASPPKDPKYEKFKSKFRKHKAPERKHRVRYKKFDCTAQTIYPAPMKSRLLCLKNLLLPFHNRRFALFIGFIYFLYAWVFQTSAPELDKKLLEMPATGATGAAEIREIYTALSRAFWAAISYERVIAAATRNPAFFFMLLGLWAGLVYYVDLGKGFFNMLGKIVLGSVHFLAHLNTLLFVNLVAFAPSVLVAAAPGLLIGALGLNEATGEMWQGIGLLLSYSIMSILIGGLIGAFIMGLYWTLTSFFLNMHCGDAFGALGIRDYKHFLRMKFEANRLTIYPIAIDKVPGRKGWHAALAEERGTQNALLAPNRPLDPHLIENPIVIETRDISSTLQRVE